MAKTRVKLVKQEDGSVAAMDTSGEIDARASGPKAKEELMDLYKGAISQDELEFVEEGFEPVTAADPSSQAVVIDDVDEPEPANPETHMVPYAAMKSEREKRKTLSKELASLKAAAERPSVSPHTPPVIQQAPVVSDTDLIKQLFGEDVDADGSMTVTQGAKILRTAIGLVTAQQQLQQFDGFLDTFASRPEKQGMLITPKRAVALVRPHLANNPQAKLSILQAPNPHYVIYKLAQELQTLSDLDMDESVDSEPVTVNRPPLTTTTQVSTPGVTVHPSSKGRTARELANNMTHESLNAQTAVHPSSQIAGDNNLNVGDPSTALLKQFQGIGNIFEYAKEYAKLTPEQRAALDKKFV